MTKEFQKTLRHDDFTITTDLCTSVTWMETMMGSLTHLQKSKHRYVYMYLLVVYTTIDIEDCVCLRSLYIYDTTIVYFCLHNLRIQQLHFEMAETIAELKETQLRHRDE